MKIDSGLRSRGHWRRHGRYLRLTMLLLVTAGALLSPVPAAHCSAAPPTPEEIARLKSNLPALDFTAKQVFSPQLAALFRYYGLESRDAAHLFGTFDSGSDRLAAHVYLPHAAVGSAFLLHGFFDHSGILRNLIHRCIKEGLAVAIFDLPGHGLSAGDPGAIPDFGAYARILRDFVRICTPHLPGPYHLVGHSTGASIAIEAMGNHPPQMPVFGRVVLAAPLVHHRFHRLARAQLVLIKPFADDLPRWHRRSSSDPVFVHWSKQDPLQGRRIALTWLEALYSWNDRLTEYRPIAHPVMILQGTKDRVVDWRYNIAALQKRFTTVRVEWIEGGHHQLFNEAPAIRAEVLQTVSAYLMEPAPPGQQ